MTTDLTDNAPVHELLPCPFCGGAAKHVRRNDSHETYRFVVCSENSEHRSGNGCYNQAPGRNGDSGKCYKCWNEGIDCVFATKAWNARAAIAAMPANIEITPTLQLAKLVSKNEAQEAENARLRAINAGLVEAGNALNLAADEINGEIDAQTYDEKRRLRDWEDDHRWEIVVTAGEERTLNKSLCAWQSYVRTLATADQREPVLDARGVE